MPKNYQIIDNKKYLWDGKAYDAKDAAYDTAERYKKDNFAVKVIEEESKYLLYTRREAAVTTT